MKNLLAACFLMSFSFGAFAAPTVIKANVPLKNEKFAGLVYEALEKNGNPKREVRAGATTSTISVGGGLTCQKADVLVSGGKIKTKYSCSLMKKAGWKTLGKGIYGAGDNEAFVEALFETLDLKPEVSEAFSAKTIELAIPNGQGGTERNKLACLMPTAEGIELGVSGTCQVVNAL